MPKITEIPAAGPLTGAELVPVVQDDETKLATLGEVVESVAQPFVDQAEEILTDIEAAYTAYGSVTLVARLLNIENALGIGHTPPLPPEFRDDFTSAGNLNGRTGWTVETRPPFTSQINAISAASGKAGGTTGSAAWALHTAAVVDARVSVKIGTLGTWLHHFANIAATDAERDWLNIGMTQSVSGGILTGFISLNKVVNAGGQTLVATLAGHRPEVGDVLTSEFSTSGGVTYWTAYLNGFQIGDPVDVREATTGVALNRKHGFMGNVANAVDSFQVANPATEVSLRLIQPNRTVAFNADGSITWHISVAYTGPDPKALFASVYDNSTGSPVLVMGLERVQVASYTATGGVASGTITATAAQIASGGPFHLRVIREGLLTSGGALAESHAEGPLQKAGDVFGAAGQSLGVAVSTQTVTTDVYAEPADCWHLTGTPATYLSLGLPWTRNYRPVSANTTAAAFAGTYKTLVGRNVSMASGGAGGTTIAQRAVGTPSHDAMIEAHGRLGKRFSMIRHTDGQSDVTTAVATYTASLQAVYDDMATRNGGTIKVLMNPLASAWKLAGGNDDNWQDTRRAQWKLTQDYPTRYFIGAYVLDVQKFDELHLTANGYGVMAVREAHAAAKALGHIAHDRNGPSLYSVTRIDAQTVYCLYDLNGADSLELANTAYAGEYHGGMVYSTAETKTGGTIATKRYPSGATVDASPSGGRQGITFTFAANTFPGTVFAWAAYGKNPFNPNDNNTGTDPINLDMAGKASMIRGVYADGMKVALRPRFTADGLDYLSAV